jgi:hypothetical protein
MPEELRPCSYTWAVSIDRILIWLGILILVVGAVPAAIAWTG